MRVVDSSGGSSPSRGVDWGPENAAQMRREKVWWRGEKVRRAQDGGRSPKEKKRWETGDGSDSACCVLAQQARQVLLARGGGRRRKYVVS